MDEFLNKMYSNLEFDESWIYKELSFINVPEYEKDLFSGYGKSVTNKYDEIIDSCHGKNTVVFPYEYWLLMINKHFFRKDKKYIKLYMPVKYNNLVNTVSDTVNFLDDENILHNSKMASEIRNDNFIIRLNYEDKDVVNDILSFIESKKYNSTSLNEPSPFLPSIDNVGIMIEEGYSYNSDISKLVSSFLKTCALNDCKEVHKEDFKDYIENLKNNNLCNSYTYETFMCAYYQEKNKELVLRK